jgi:hypothetical protein
MKRFPSSRCASAIQIVRPAESTTDTQPQLQPALLRLLATSSQYFTNLSADSAGPTLFRADLQCNRPDMSDEDKKHCRGWREAAGKNAVSFNENLSMMKALAEVALAADSALYRASPKATAERLQLATEEVPLLIAKNVAFFADNLRPNTLPDGTPYFEWSTQPSTPEVIEDTNHGGFEIDCLAVILDDQIRLNALLARAGRAERVPLSPPERDWDCCKQASVFY